MRQLIPGPEGAAVAVWLSVRSERARCDAGARPKRELLVSPAWRGNRAYLIVSCKPSAAFYGTALQHPSRNCHPQIAGVSLLLEHTH